MSDHVAARRKTRRWLALTAFGNAVALLWALLVGAFVGFEEQTAAAIGAIGTGIATLLGLVGWYMKLGSNENLEAEKTEGGA